MHVAGIAVLAMVVGAILAELGMLASRFGADTRDGFAGRDECRTCPT